MLRAWLHAAEGEMLANLGERDDALRALDRAHAALPERTIGNGLPYLMLDSGHLERWRGHCLARLGEPAAIASLTAALGAMGEGQFGRAEASLRVDLALAFRLGATQASRVRRPGARRSWRAAAVRSVSAGGSPNYSGRVTSVRPAHSGPERAAGRPAPRS
jgi:hypothetical protein